MFPPTVFGLRDTVTSEWHLLSKEATALEPSAELNTQFQFWLLMFSCSPFSWCLVGAAAGEPHNHEGPLTHTACSAAGPGCLVGEVLLHMWTPRFFLNTLRWKGYLFLSLNCDFCPWGSVLKICESSHSKIENPDCVWVVSSAFFLVDTVVLEESSLPIYSFLSFEGCGPWDKPVMGSPPEKTTETQCTGNWESLFQLAGIALRYLGP